MKKKLVLKPFVVPVLYTVFALVVIVSLFFSIETETEKDDLTYVNGIIIDQYIPVISYEESIIKPFTDENVSVINKFYDSSAPEEDQTNSLIYYENTYVQNTGINYTSENKFDVISILEGEVIEVENKELLGKSVTIRHDNELISVYQSLGEVSIKKGDRVSIGQIIGTSGKCDILKNSENNLHFELYANGSIVNPENYYNKKLSEL